MALWPPRLLLTDSEVRACRDSRAGMLACAEVGLGGWGLEVSGGEGSVCLLFNGAENLCWHCLLRPPGRRLRRRKPPLRLVFVCAAGCPWLGREGALSLTPCLAGLSLQLFAVRDLRGGEPAPSFGLCVMAHASMGVRCIPGSCVPELWGRADAIPKDKWTKPTFFFP